MKVGRRIYYDISTGNVILDTGERQGSVVPTTVEKDFQSYSALTERIRDTVGVLDLEYGQYAQDFAESNGYRVNPETKELEFSYPDPNKPEAPQPFQRPLSEIVNEQMDYLLDVDFRLSMVELGLI